MSPPPHQEELSNHGARVPSQETNQTQSGPQPSVADADMRLPEFIWRPEEASSLDGHGAGGGGQFSVHTRSTLQFPSRPPNCFIPAARLQTDFRVSIQSLHVRPFLTDKGREGWRVPEKPSSMDKTLKPLSNQHPPVPCPNSQDIVFSGPNGQDNQVGEGGSF